MEKICVSVTAPMRGKVESSLTGLGLDSIRQPYGVEEGIWCCLTGLRNACTCLMGRRMRRKALEEGACDNLTGRCAAYEEQSSYGTRKVFGKSPGRKAYGPSVIFAWTPKCCVEKELLRKPVLPIHAALAGGTCAALVAAGPHFLSSLRPAFEEGRMGLFGRCGAGHKAV